MKALTLSAFGSSDVLEYREVSDPVLKEGEILVEMKAIGLNFADVMRRKGDYPMRGHAPYINGYEGAGIVKDTNHHPAFRPRATAHPDLQTIGSERHWPRFFRGKKANSIRGGR